VDGARAHDDDEAVVLTPQDSHDRLPPVADGGRAALAEGQFLQQDRRREEGPEALDAKISRSLGHEEVPYLTVTAPSKPRREREAAS
jgi:hypothetical protein